jgi:hypothetical protein
VYYYDKNSREKAVQQISSIENIDNAMCERMNGGIISKDP